VADKLSLPVSFTSLAVICNSSEAERGLRIISGGASSITRNSVLLINFPADPETNIVHVCMVCGERQRGMLHSDVSTFKTLLFDWLQGGGEVIYASKACMDSL